MIKNSNTQTASLAPQLIAGIKKHLSTTTTVVLGSASYTPAQLETSFQTLLDLLTAVDAARTATSTQVTAEKTQSPPLRSLMAAFVAFVKVSYGNAPNVLADFGLKPNKVAATLTPAQKAAAAAKRAATRAARHTMGTKQKKAVKGTINVIVPQPPAAAPAPTVPTTTPAIPPAPVVAHPTTPTGV